MASIEKRGSTYKIVVSNGYDINKKKIRESTIFAPDPKMTEKQQKKALEKFAFEFEQKVINGKYFKGEKTILKEFIDVWLKEYACDSLEETTLSDYKLHIDNKILPAMGHLKLTEISPLGLQCFYNSLAEDGVRKDKKKGGYAPGTIRKVHCVISSILSSAVAWEILESNPCEKVSPTDKSKMKKIREKNSVNTRSIKYFTPEQTEWFLDAMNAEFKYSYKGHDRTDDTGKNYHVDDYISTKTLSTQFKVFFILALFGGCRRGELIALTWSDIDFDNNTIDINKSAAYVNKKVLIKSTKNNSSCRIIALSEGIMKVLKHYKAEQSRFRLYQGDAWQDGNYLFTQSNGVIMNPSTPYQKFKEIIHYYNSNITEESLKLPDIPLHGLRHTSATLLIAENIDVRTVSGRLGHSQTSTTMNIYAHNLQKKDVLAASALDKYLPVSGDYLGTTERKKYPMTSYETKEDTQKTS